MKCMEQVNNFEEGIKGFEEFVAYDDTEGYIQIHTDELILTVKLESLNMRYNEDLLDWVIGEHLMELDALSEFVHEMKATALYYAHYYKLFHAYLASIASPEMIDAFRKMQYYIYEYYFYKNL